MAAFALAAGIEMVHVPYRGTAPMMNDLIAGTIDLAFTDSPAALPLARDRMLRAFDVSSPARLSAAPEVPIVAEKGLSDFEANQRYGLPAPARTPEAIVTRLNEACAAALCGDTLRQRLAAEGAAAAPGMPGQFRDFIMAKRARWGEVVRRANLKLD